MSEGGAGALHAAAPGHKVVVARVRAALAVLIRHLRETGDRGHQRRHAHGQEAIRIAEAVDHPYSLIFACLFLASSNSVRGELRPAARLLERAVAQCHEWNIQFLSPLATASLGYVHAWSGRVGEGVALLQQALTAHEATGIGYFQSLSVVQLGEAYLLADRVGDARACANRAVMLARERGERGQEAWALRLLGEIAARDHHPDVATAEAHYVDALSLASALGMRPLAAHCRLGRGTLYAKIGRREQALSELSAALESYRAMGMTFWLSQAGAALAQVESQ